MFYALKQLILLILYTNYDDKTCNVICFREFRPPSSRLHTWS